MSPVRPSPRLCRCTRPDRRSLTTTVKVCGQGLGQTPRLRAPEGIKRSAAEQGPAVAEFADRLFDGPLPWAKVKQGHKLVRLGQRYTPERLDDACRRALDVDLIDVRRVERILVQALERSEATEHPPPLPAGRFARPGSAHAKGGQT